MTPGRLSEQDLCVLKPVESSFSLDFPIRALGTLGVFTDVRPQDPRTYLPVTGPELTRVAPEI